MTQLTALPNEHDALKDRIYAAMETGNQGQARTLLREYKDINASAAERIRMDVLAEYGQSL